MEFEKIYDGGERHIIYENNYKILFLTFGKFSVVIYDISTFVVISIYG